MQIVLLNKEDVVEIDPINMEAGLEKSIIEDDKRIEEESKLYDTSRDNGEYKKSIRKKIIEFLKNEEFIYKEGDQEIDNETNDIFAKNGILIDVTITIGVDDDIIKQIMESDMI